MNAQDRLRTIRAKIAVLEGKIALAIMLVQFLLSSTVLTLIEIISYIFICLMT